MLFFICFLKKKKKKTVKGWFLFIGSKGWDSEVFDSQKELPGLSNYSWPGQCCQRNRGIHGTRPEPAAREGHPCQHSTQQKQWQLWRQVLNLVISFCDSAVFFFKSKLSGSTDLSYKDFKQALQGFTPPSLWGAQLQTPTGAGMERIGGLHQARQLLMDIILLPAKVWQLLCTKCLFQSKKQNTKKVWTSKTQIGLRWRTKR